MAQPPSHRCLLPQGSTECRDAHYFYQAVQRIVRDLADRPRIQLHQLTDDWQGADPLDRHFDGATTLKGQLKARSTIDRKYAGKDLWMNFPWRGSWRLVHHDHLDDM